MARRPKALAPLVIPEEQIEPFAVEPPAPAINLTVTNCIKGTTLCLADGRSIQHGESAEVSAEEAEFLRGRGQVE